MNNIDILEEDVKNILNCCTDIETLISLDERAKEDLKNNTHNIQQHEVLTIIREFIRCKNDCSNLIAENKELKEFKENIERIDKKQLDKLYKDAQKALKEYRETQNKVAKLEEENKELKEKIKEINEEYNAEQKHEMENTIPKSKVKEILKELDKTDSKISKSLFNDDCGT